MRRNCKLIIIFGFTFLSILGLFSINALSNKISLTNISSSQDDSVGYSGDYEGNISVVYFYQGWNNTMWNGVDHGNYNIAHNATDGFTPYEYKLNNLDISGFELNNGTNDYRIADNKTEWVNLTAGASFAQEFTAPELLSVYQIKLFLNYSYLIGPVSVSYIHQIWIYDENFETVIASGDYYDSRKQVNEWLSFNIWRNNILESGKKYNIVYNILYDGNNPGIDFNFWKAENYSSPTSDKGKTRVYNGTDWNVVKNDTYRDLLCNFSYYKLIHPQEVDLKYHLEGVEYTPQYRPHPWQRGYEAYLSYDLLNPIDQVLNITWTANQTIPTLQIEIEIYYTFLINASGSYSANENSLDWTILYDFENLPMMGFPPLLLFEHDWDFITLLDPDGYEMTDVYFGPINLYNKKYFGVTTLFGPMFVEGIYTGTYTAPNYCNKINTKIESGSGFNNALTLSLGQTLRVEAEIRNTQNQPISGGVGEIKVITPTGKIIHSETDLISIDGFLESSNINLNADYGAGVYTITAFWTNGREIAYFTKEVEVTDPMFIIILVGIIVTAAIAATPIALVVRRQIKQRNWEKTLKDLFVLTRDGVGLYEYSFGIEIQDPALISGMIAALTNFVREATGSKKSLRTIDQEDKIVFLYHGTKITVALMAEKDLPIIHKRVRKFGEAFEEKYGPLLKKWRGEQNLFKEAEILVNTYFPIDVEEQIIRGVRTKLIEFREHLNRLEHPREIIKLMRDITEFISRYQAIVNQNYLDYYNQIIVVAEQKISGKLGD